MLQAILFYSFIPPLLTQRIEASDFFSLDSSAWTLTSSAGDVIQAVVPGDVVSALSASGRIASTPWLDLTWREQAGLWDLQGWTYALTFTAPFSAPPGGDVWLVLEGVKLAADIAFNNASLGFTANQHLRYVFSVGALLASPGAPNVLTVSFPPTVADVRFARSRPPARHNAPLCHARPTAPQTQKTETQ
jgi:hypothetical protein